MKNKFFHFLFIFLLCIVVAFTYRLLLRGFFEQDEWSVFATNIIFNHASFGEQLKFIFTSSGIFSHFIPLGVISSFWEIDLFGLSARYYELTSIVLHIVCVIGVYIFTYQLVRQRLLAGAAGILFGIHSLSSQSVTWIAASLADGLSTGFFLGSAILYIHFRETNKISWFWLSIVFFTLSIISKETTITLAFFFPGFDWLRSFNDQKFVWKKLIPQWILFPLLIVGTFLIKALLLIINRHPHPATLGDVQQYPLLITSKLLMYPLLVLAQIFDTNGIIFFMSKQYMLGEYPMLQKSPSIPKLIETIVPDMLYLLVSIILLASIVLSLYYMYKERKIEYRVVLFTLAGFFLSVIPYIPLPRFTSFLEPRYYYTPNIFAVILFTVIAWYWLKKWMGNTFARVCFCLLISIICVANYQKIQVQIGDKLVLAQERKQVLYQMKHLLPTLSKGTNVFYVTGVGSDYLIPDLKVPFQNGFGSVLMVWYYNPEVIHNKLLDDGYLYGLDEQGYRMVGNTGFGYYFQNNVLQQDLMKGKFKTTDIYAFSWNRTTQKLTDITPTVRKKLSSL